MSIMVMRDLYTADVRLTQVPWITTRGHETPSNMRIAEDNVLLIFIQIG